MPTAWLQLPDQDKNPVDGSVLLLSPDQLTRDSQPVILLAGDTCEVSNSNWGLAAFTFSSKCLGDDGMPASSFTPRPLCWGPRRTPRHGRVLSLSSSWSTSACASLEQRLTGVMLDGTLWCVCSQKRWPQSSAFET